MSWTSTLRVCSGRGPSEVISLALLEEVARDHELLDLAGPLVDPEGAHLPVQALDGRPAHHALATVPSAPILSAPRSFSQAARRTRRRAASRSTCISASAICVAWKSARARP